MAAFAASVAAETEEIAKDATRKMVRNLGWMTAEFARFPRLTKENVEKVVILEGTAVEVDLAEKATLKKLNAASRAKYKVPLMVVPESVLYSVRPRGVLAWTEKDFPHNPLGIRHRLNGPVRFADKRTDLRFDVLRFAVLGAGTLPHSIYSGS